MWKIRILTLVAVAVSMAACGNPVEPTRATAADRRADETCTPSPTTTCTVAGGGLLGGGN
jgi:hypothetical protein